MKRYYLIMIIIVVLILGIFIMANSFKTTMTTSKYYTYGDATNSTRIAKWHISKEGMHEGENLNLTTTFNKTLNSKTQGNWFLEIHNNSEVTAIIDALSNVKMRLEHDNITQTSSNQITWHYYNTSDTLYLSFNLTLYHGSINDLIVGYKHQYTNEIISPSAYSLLSMDERSLYIEIFDDQIESYALFNLLNETSFNKTREVIGSELHYYYEHHLSINVEDVVMAFNDYLTLVLSWEVKELGVDDLLYNEEFLSYHLLYDGDDIIGYNTSVNNLFEYGLFLSSIGGEARCSFIDSLNNHKYVKVYSELTELEKQTFRNYTLSDGYLKYCEGQNLINYEKYLNINSQILDKKYFDGLSINFIFDLIASQKD